MRKPLGRTLLAQGIGLDAVSLVVVAPLAVAAGVLTLRRRPLGPVLELGVFLPLAVATGLALWRNHAWARTGFHLVVGWFALVGLAVAAMAATMWLHGDPAMSRGQMAAFVVAALVLVGLEVRLLRSLVRDPGTDGSPSDDSPASGRSSPDGGSARDPGGG